MIASIISSTLYGVEGRPVRVEVHVSNGLPGFTVVGLPDAACRESRDRVRAALLSSGLPWPLRRVTVNLAPSGQKKGGAGLDLPIAVGLLAATGELPVEAVGGCGFLGELGLDGGLRPVAGTVSLVDAMQARAVVVPAASAAEASLVGGLVVRPVATLRQLVDACRGHVPWPEPPPPPALPASPEEAPFVPDLADVLGQRFGRKAVEVAAAGGHHLLLVGPPGSGKTMLAERMPGILPPLRPDEAMQTVRVYSAAGLRVRPAAGGLRPPFRAPHHGASAVSLIGGGSGVMRPGEVSLAHNGVLFLDEMAEFAPAVLDGLRQPLEEGRVTVCRAASTATFPARFLLVAAMNPCPCGGGLRPGYCRCSEGQRSRYARRVSGPLMDRFDLRVAVARPTVAELMGEGAAGEPTAVVAARVREARRRSAARGWTSNAAVPAARLDEAAPLTHAAASLLQTRLASGGLSARGLHRVRRVARTLADLDEVGPVGEEHVALALQLRAAARELTGAGA